MEVEIKQNNNKVGDNIKKILYPGSRLFIIEGGKVQGPEILKQPAKFVSYRQLTVNESKSMTKEGGREIVMVNGSMEISPEAIVITNDTRFEQKEGQKKLFMTGSEKLAKELSANTNIVERERLRQIAEAINAQIEFLTEVIDADSSTLH